MDVRPTVKVWRVTVQSDGYGSTFPVRGESDFPSRLAAVAADPTLPPGLEVLAREGTAPPQGPPVTDDALLSRLLEEAEWVVDGLPVPA